ncbi:MAG: polysaccharide lyase 6 family protein [Brevundimonas sp.]|uniref:polysaccharide lyase 6 family protein n=1 Tax=Brevundimonas sp. TaxID=1871086 RepID=UPI002722170E|nr:polysaccharide lyase 6 family protein [Brevundimonas sp.]MDO9588546.1 polysaccharide lyase 6 family protein [Brevundimonas sp.]MDP3370090.1 polysaccharide lyase 6 family protein [Brevundimonas sp.]
MPFRVFMIAALAILLSVLTPDSAKAADMLARTQGEFAAAVRQARAGDTITLADGEWRDFQILFTGQGQRNKPITLTAQTPGGVILTGQSNLRMAGEFLLVSNLVFRDGWSPTGEVVSFRRTRAHRANNSRVTGVVIDGFSKQRRDESDNWVAIYGRHNRFDHNHLVGKTNAGTTLVVVRDAEQGLENRHLIDHNYFGHRPNLGSNGGETIRIGTSHDSESDSFTVVTSNWFERCDGEVEIISNKSGANVYRGNVFFESRGALVLRHGDGNLVEDNVFIGNGVENTGGIRVINRRNTVRNNYLENLRGTNFGSALTIMYGVPNSPLNRYVRVDQAIIENNTIIDVAQVFFGAGMDDERSAAPVNSRFADNLIVNRDGRDPFRLLGDMGGVAFSGNIQSPSAISTLPGFEGRHVPVARGQGRLLIPEGADGVGARRDLQFVARSAVGVDWYPKEARSVALDSGQIHVVEPGEDTLTAAVLAARPGDRLQLGAGQFVVNQVLPVTRALTVQGPETGEARITFSRPTLFEITRAGSLKLSRLRVSGSAAPDEAGNAVVRAREGAAGYRLEIENSRFDEMKVNRAFSVFAAGPRTLAEIIRLENVTAEGLTGSVIAAAADTQDLGTYNAEQVEIAGSAFLDIAGPVIDLYRGGTDESTFGPRLTLTDSTFERVGAGGAESGAIRMHGVQRAELTGNRFSASGPVRFHRQVGEPLLIWRNNAGAELVANVVPVETAP